MDAEGGSSKPPNDFDVLKRMNHSLAKALVAQIEYEVKTHLEQLVEDSLGKSAPEEEKEQFRKSSIYLGQQRSYSQFLTTKYLSEREARGELRKDFKKEQTHEKTEAKKEHEKKSGKKSAAQKELEEKKDALKGKKEKSPEPKKETPKLQSKEEIISFVEQKNPIIKTFLQAAPVADILIAQHNADEEDFYEAIENSSSPKR